MYLLSLCWKLWGQKDASPCGASLFLLYTQPKTTLRQTYAELCVFKIFTFVPSYVPLKSDCCAAGKAATTVVDCRVIDCEQILRGKGRKCNPLRVNAPVILCVWAALGRMSPFSSVHVALNLHVLLHLPSLFFAELPNSCQPNSASICRKHLA